MIFFRRNFISKYNNKSNDDDDYERTDILVKTKKSIPEFSVFIVESRTRLPYQG
jgi:hypothetical protein